MGYLEVAGSIPAIRTFFVFNVFLRNLIYQKNTLKNMVSKQKFVLFFLISLIIMGLLFPLIAFSGTITTHNFNGTTTKKVAAFYYQWYGNTTNYSSTSPYNVTDNDQWWHWDDKGFKNWTPPVNACSPHTPVMGWYDSADPELIRYHLNLAQWAGIDALVSSYWGRNGQEFKNIKTMAEVSKSINSSVKIALYFEIFMSNLPEMNSSAQITFLVDEFRFIYQFMNDPNYKNQMWFENGKPVLWIYVVRAISPEVWNSVLSQLNSENINFFLVADRPKQDSNHIAQFQGQHIYDVYAPIRDNTYLEQFWRIKEQSKTFNQIMVAGVAPGYNDTVVRAGNEPFSRENGKFYHERWCDALSLNPDWISITSWNEWHEGTEIEPSIEHGDLALNQTKDYIQQFKTGNYTTLSPTYSIGKIFMHDALQEIGIGSGVIIIGIVSLIIWYRKMSKGINRN